jgi:inorganic pyrophosphatase
MNHFHDIKQDKAPEILKLLTEISKGDFVKYEFNREYGILEVDRVLYGPVHYPVVYADVPQTWKKEMKIL